MLVKGVCLGEGTRSRPWPVCQALAGTEPGELIAGSPERGNVSKGDEVRDVQREGVREGQMDRREVEDGWRVREQNWA